jgi:hypothetical protein
MSRASVMLLPRSLSAPYRFPAPRMLKSKSACRIARAPRLVAVVRGRAAMRERRHPIAAELVGPVVEELDPRSRTPDVLPQAGHLLVSGHAGACWLADRASSIPGSWDSQPAVDAGPWRDD